MARRRAEGIVEMGGRCVDCGATSELELDHIDPSNKVAHTIWSWSEPRRKAEMAKCTLRCKACHIDRTKRQRREQIVEVGERTLTLLHRLRKYGD